MKNEQHEQARNLFFETDLSQAQIAELVGISQKTMSLWTNDGDWRRLRRLANETPLVMTEQLFSEVSCINQAIRSREPGKQFATREEADIRKKTLASIKYIKEEQTPSAHAEVILNFMTYLRRKDLTAAQVVAKHADKYLKGEVYLGNPNPPFISYTLPGVTGVPADDTAPDVDDKDLHSYIKRWDKLVNSFKDLQDDEAA